MNPMMHMHYGIEGIYRLRTREAGSGIVTQDTGWRENVITNRGLDLMYTADFSYSKMFGNCAVGVGTTPPTIYDSSMDSLVATTYSHTTQRNLVDKTPNGPMYWNAISKYTFPTGAAEGNITEIGVYPEYNSANGDIFSRMLIKDSMGNPTSITVLPYEILDVEYEVRMYIDTSDKSVSWTLGQSTVITGTSRPSKVNIVTWAEPIPSRNDTVLSSLDDLTDIYHRPSERGSCNVNHDTPTRNQFVNDTANSGTCWVDGECTFSPGNGNGTLKSFIIMPNYLPSTQIGNLSQPIVKGQGQYLNMTYRYSWGRHTP